MESEEGHMSPAPTLFSLSETIAGEHAAQDTMEEMGKACGLEHVPAWYEVPARLDKYGPPGQAYLMAELPEWDQHHNYGWRMGTWIEPWATAIDQLTPAAREMLEQLLEDNTDRKSFGFLYQLAQLTIEKDT